MAEVKFAQQFLQTLDERTIKIPADHAADPRTYPAQAYILPKHSSAPTKRKRPSPPSTPLNVSIKSLKDASQSVSLGAQPRITSIFDIRRSYAEELGYTPEKVKLLYAKKAVSDYKSVGELAGDGATSVELGVMLLGKATLAPKAKAKTESEVTEPTTSDAIPKVQGEAMDIDKDHEREAGNEAEAPVAQGESGAQVLQSPEFWDDIKAFLLQRVRDEKEADRLAILFKNAWEREAA